MLSARRHTGFTIIELLVGITILAIVLGLGAPAMGSYLQNSKLGSAAANFHAGLQLARTEAIRRNIQTQFVMTDSALTGVDPANTIGTLASGRSWMVRASQPAPLGFIQVDKKASSEGEGSVVAPSLVVQGTGPAGFAGIVAFNGFGNTADNLPYRIDVSNPAAGLCAPAGPVRCRSITVTPGGQINSCDPAAPAGDSRAC
jgi:type IV fimbrial biogenesis protein FimT